MPTHQPPRPPGGPPPGERSSRPGGPSSDRRRAHHQPVDNQAVGRRGEALAAAWYEANGYTVLDRNWRCRAGELDLVLAGVDTVVFCEVKTRRSASHGTGVEAVDHRKRRKVREVAMAWLQASDTRYPEVRFDVADVDGAGRVSIIEGCF